MTELGARRSDGARKTEKTKQHITVAVRFPRCSLSWLVAAFPGWSS